MSFRSNCGRTVYVSGVAWGVAFVLMAEPVSVQGTTSEATSAAITVSTSAESGSVRQGDILTIKWESRNAPPGSAVALWPLKALTDRLFSPLADGLPTNGGYQWLVPLTVPQPVPCAPDRTGGCAGSMNPGTTYKIVARLYVPRDADVTQVGGGKTYPTFVAVAESRPFEILPALAR